MWEIKTPCVKCGKRRMIKSLCALTRTYVEIRVLTRKCHKCGHAPKQRYMRRELNPQSVSNALFKE